MSDTVPTSLPSVPEIRSQVRQHGRWWWFCHSATMKDVQPVLIGYDDKYDNESPCYFQHPWGMGNKRFEEDKDRPKWTSDDHRYVRNWKDCFFGPCLCAPEIGIALK